MAVIMFNYRTKFGFTLDRAYGRINFIQGSKEQGWVYHVDIYGSIESRVRPEAPVEHIVQQCAFMYEDPYLTCYKDLKTKFKDSEDELTDHSPVQPQIEPETLDA